MSTMSLRVHYRPVRIGWCIEWSQQDHLQAAMRLTHAFAGGRFNPVIPVDSPRLAQDLLDRFCVDVLFPVASTERINQFIASHDYLSWPEFEATLFHEEWQHIPPCAAFVDVYHAARRLGEAADRRREMILVTCADDDPLAMLLLATSGAYPASSSSIPDYEELAERFLGIKRIALGREDAIPPEILTGVTPSRLSTMNLQCGDKGPDHGIYVGDADSCEDIANFWNLRAAGGGLVFFDPREATRLGPLLEAQKRWLGSIPARPWQQDGAITVFGREQVEQLDLSKVVDRAVRHRISVESWNGLNIKPAVHHWKEQAVLGTVDDSQGTPTLTFALPRKPAYDHPGLFRQQIALSVRGSDPWTMEGEATFFPPYVPDLNEFFGRGLYFYERVRAEPWSTGRSVALIVDCFQSDVTLKALPSSTLTIKLLERFGITAQPSQAGIVTRRLIAQMDGLQGCRVFKIEGVRRLIQKYPPDQSFTRSHANQMIGNNDAEGKPHFEPYENLAIAPRPFQQKLKPPDVFDFLLQQGVFRVGLELKCSHCELEFWCSVDEAKRRLECVYCGKLFDIANQLRDRDWAYRRSGLFGRDDHQQGGIPVALTLQQLDTALSFEKMLWTTSLELRPASAGIEACEVDFVAIANGRSRTGLDLPQVVLGECKTAGRVEPSDAERLARVADALPDRRVNVFVLFAKTAAFTEEEILACTRAQDRWNPRVILLSKDELEPYQVFDRHEKIEGTRRGLEALANTTTQLYPPLRPQGLQDLDRQ